MGSIFRNQEESLNPRNLGVPILVKCTGDPTLGFCVAPHVSLHQQNVTLSPPCASAEEIPGTLTPFLQGAQVLPGREHPSGGRHPWA